MPILITSPNGATTTRATLAAAISAAMTGGKTIVVTTPITLSLDATIPATIGLKVTDGGLITVASAKTLTINGTLESSAVQIFAGAGSVVIGGTIEEILPEWWGAKADGSTVSHAAIQSAIDSFTTGKGRVKLSVGTYAMTAGITIAKNSVWLVGSGREATTLNFAPTGNNQTCITVSAGASILGYGGITDLTVYSENSSYVKTAIKVQDTVGYVINNIMIYGSVAKNSTSMWSDNSNGSFGIVTNGRDTLSASNLYIQADYPLYLGRNTNATELATDHFNFHNLYLVANTHACITAAATIYMSNLSFTGYQAWVLGANGFEVIAGAGTAQSASVSFDNVRYEQGAATGYFLKIGTNYGISSVIASNCYMGNNNGVYARNTLNLTMIGCLYAGAAGKSAINVDSTCYAFESINCQWGAGSTATYTGMEIVSSSPNNIATSPLASNTRLESSSYTNNDFVVGVGLTSNPFLVTAGSESVLGSIQLNGCIYITNSGGVGALFVINGGYLDKISDPQNAFTMVKDTADKTNVYYDGVAFNYIIQNSYASDAYYKAVIIGNTSAY